MSDDGIKGLDVKKGLSMVSNSKVVYIKLLKSFAANAFCDKLLEAINSGDPEGIQKSAHSLKGVAGNMHMDDLYELSRSIESDVKSGMGISAGDEKVARLIDANRLTLESINCLLANPDILDSFL